MGMWESRVLCEISKLLWKSFCDFHRSVISTAASSFESSPPRLDRGIADPGRPADRRSWGLLCGRLSMQSDVRSLRRSPFSHAIALALGGDHRRVMGQPIQQGRRELLVAGKDRDPFGKREIRRHDGGPALVPIGDQIEEQLAADAVEGHEAQLVDDEDVDAQEPLLQPRELAGIARFEQLPDQIGGAREEHAPFLFRRFDAERDRQMRLAGADRAGEDQILRAR